MIGTNHGVDLCKVLYYDINTLYWTYSDSTDSPAAESMYMYIFFYHVYIMHAAELR